MINKELSSSNILNKFERGSWVQIMKQSYTKNLALWESEQKLIHFQIFDL